MSLGKTAKFYRDNPASYRKKLKQANSHPVWGEQTKKRKDKRVDDARARRKAKREGKNIKNKQWDILTKTFMSPSENMGQNEASRVKGSKRNKRNWGKHNIA